MPMESNPYEEFINRLINTNNGYAEKAAIIDISNREINGTILAKSSNFNLTNLEISTILENYEEENFSEEFFIDNILYIAELYNSNSVYGKNNNIIIFCEKTNNFLLICTATTGSGYPLDREISRLGNELEEILGRILENEF